MVDDLHALTLRVDLGVCEIDFRGDTDQVELGTGCHLVDDLGDRREGAHGRSMLGRRVEVTAAVVLSDQRNREIAARLRGGEAAEACVDDGDLDAGAVVPTELPATRAGRLDGLVGDGLQRVGQGRTHPVDARCGDHAVELVGSGEDLDQIPGRALDLDAIRGDALLGQGQVRSFDDQADLALGHGQTELAGLSERSLRAVGAGAGSQLGDLRIGS